GLAVLYELWDRYPAISVVVLSAQLDHNRVVKALDRGARGFISKSAQLEVMLGALRLVFAGGIYIPAGSYRAGRAASSAKRSGGVRGCSGHDRTRQKRPSPQPSPITRRRRA